MTDETREIGGTVGPPWSVDVLADLHAGVLDDAQAAELWPLVNADPDAREILDALDATQADLAALADAPVAPMPAEFAARLDAALAAEAVSRQAASFRESAQHESAQREEAQTPAPEQAGPGDAQVVDLAAARRKRNQRIGWGAGILTAAAAAVVAVAITVPGSSTDGTGTPNVAAPASGPSVGSDGSGAEALLGKTLGIRDFGPLQTEQRLDQCLGAYGLDTKIRPEGVRPVNVDGKAGVLATFTTGKFAQYRLIAFGADCGPGKPAVLFDKIVGEK